MINNIKTKGNLFSALKQRPSGKYNLNSKAQFIYTKQKIFHQIKNLPSYQQQALAIIMTLPTNKMKKELGKPKLYKAF